MVMEKINVAELLKDCPKGMELDCYLFNGLEFDHLDKNNGTYPIICRVKTEFGSYNIHTFNEYGCYSMAVYSKCVIFPKGKTTWEGFQIPFKDGDIVATDLGSVFILKSCLEDNIHYHSYIGVTCCNEIQEKQIPFAYKYDCHLATEEEKQKLFQAIKDNGYKWDEETKTLEKLIDPKFKIEKGKWYVCIKDLLDNYANKAFRKGDTYLSTQDGSLIPSNSNVPFELVCPGTYFRDWTIQDAKEGDVLAFNDEIIVIFKDLYNKTSFHSYCHIEDGIFTISKEDMPDWWEGRGFYPATKEQCNILFQKIKATGYEWNPETKTLEVVQKFKIGDKVKHKCDKNNTVITITGSKQDYYYIQYYNIIKNDYQTEKISFTDQDKYELIIDKFE